MLRGWSADFRPDLWRERRKNRGRVLEGEREVSRLIVRVRRGKSWKTRF